MSRKGLHYKEEKMTIAKKHGYDGPLTMMFEEYTKNEKSINQIGAMLNVTGSAVRYHLVNMGVKMRDRGGANFTSNINKFEVKCRLCDKQFKARSYHDLNTQMKEHECNGKA